MERGAIGRWFEVPAREQFAPRVKLVPVLGFEEVSRLGGMRHGHRNHQAIDREARVMADTGAIDGSERAGSEVVENDVAVDGGGLQEAAKHIAADPGAALVAAECWLDADRGVEQMREGDEQPVEFR